MLSIPGQDITSLREEDHRALVSGSPLQGEHLLNSSLWRDLERYHDRELTVATSEGEFEASAATERDKETALV
jgi:hypothetical protein